MSCGYPAPCEESMNNSHSCGSLYWIFWVQDFFSNKLLMYELSKRLQYGEGSWSKKMIVQSTSKSTTSSNQSRHWKLWETIWYGNDAWFLLWREAFAKYLVFEFSDRGVTEQNVWMSMENNYHRWNHHQVLLTTYEENILLVAQFTHLLGMVIHSSRVDVLVLMLVEMKSYE